jgi:hypothetical protein
MWNTPFEEYDAEVNGLKFLIYVGSLPHFSCLTQPTNLASCSQTSEDSSQSKNLLLKSENKN